MICLLSPILPLFFPNLSFWGKCYLPPSPPFLTFPYFGRVFFLSSVFLIHLLYISQPYPGGCSSPFPTQSDGLFLLGLSCYSFPSLCFCRLPLGFSYWGSHPAKWDVTIFFFTFLVGGVISIFILGMGSDEMGSDRLMDRSHRFFSD